MDNKNIDESQTREEREEKLRKARKTKRRNSTIKGILGMLGCMVVLVAAMYGGMALYDNLSGRGGTDDPTEAGGEKEAGEPGGSGPESGEGTGDMVEALSGSVVYSQAELDQRVAEAVAMAQDDEAERVLNGIKESLSSGTTTVETLRPYYPDDIVVASGNRIHFVPINRQLKQSQLDAANLQVLENGEYQYLTDGQVTSHKGIDVSSHQGNIDWNLVAQDGVEFAIIRLGYRGYGKEGNLREDAQFDANIQGAKAAGIKVGVYIFSQAINDDEVLAEAELVLQKIAPYQLDCPVVFDVERTSEDGRMNNISVEERTHLTLLFCQTIEDAGYTPMIYHNTQMGALMIDVAALEDYDKWYAYYSDQMFYPYEYKIWQYSDKGRIQGIGTNVDLNICFEPVWD
ncbi:MAG: glycoside hydrolase family 25 protein [Firmicutes bacterium]|nr:glycoside hydrolase family 25 protein [Bacillota bacterium]